MILSSQYILTMRNRDPFITNGAVVIQYGTIRYIGTVASALKRFPRHRLMHFGNAILMPGLVNLHTHLELPPLHKIVHARHFPDWLLNLIKAKKKLQRKDYEQGACDNVAEFLRTGTTTVGEICTHGLSPGALKKSGLRAVIFHEIIGMGPVARSVECPPRGTDLPIALVKHGISPHSPYTVSASILQSLNNKAKLNGMQLCMHVAESRHEIALMQRKRSGLNRLYRAAGWDLEWAPKGRSSFGYLRKLGILSPNLLAVHAVQVSRNDISLIKNNGVSIAHCPRSNRETAVGRMPLKSMLDAGITVGLGTDSLASSPTLSMWDEMRYARQIHKKDGIKPYDIVRLATIGGSEALHMDHAIGTLEPGKQADIIVVPVPEKHTNDFYSDLLRETKSCIMSMVNGRIRYIMK